MPNAPDRPQQEGPQQRRRHALGHLRRADHPDHVDQGDVDAHGPVDRALPIVMPDHRRDLRHHLPRQIHGCSVGWMGVGGGCVDNITAAIWGYWLELEGIVRGHTESSVIILCVSFDGRAGRPGSKSEAGAGLACLGALGSRLGPVGGPTPACVEDWVSTWRESLILTIARVFACF